MNHTMPPVISLHVFWNILINIHIYDNENIDLLQGTTRMVKQLRDFIVTFILGGLIVILPVVFLWIAFSWLFEKITGLIQPLTSLVITYLPLPETAGDIIALTIILFLCFIIGRIIRTGVGKFIHGGLEKLLLRKIPGYTMIKETLVQLLGREQTPFTKVVLVQLFPRKNVFMTGFITNETKKLITVFVPTGPNPTSGNMFHLPKEQVHILEGISVEDGLRTIIACGAGSSDLITVFMSQQMAERENEEQPTPPS